MTFFEKLPGERVQKGKAWLDANAPDWRSKVDKDRLNLRLWKDCVLGQVFTVAGLMASDLFLQLNVEGLDAYGFAGWNGDEDIIQEEWKKIL